VVYHATLGIKKKLQTEENQMIEKIKPTSIKKENIMKKLFLVFIFGLCSVAASAQTITFDNLSNSSIYDGTQIANGYEGFNWNNFGYLTTSTYTYNPSGYLNGTVSGTNVAFNWGGADASMFSQTSPFTFNSAYFTGAWNNGLNIQVKAYLAGTLVNTMSFVVDSTSPVLETFNWSNIDALTFSSSGGTSAGYMCKDVSICNHFAMDNMVVNDVIPAVPEPATYAMLFAGLGLIGFNASRKRNTIN
jgi:PEP-CTERM motif